VTEELWGHLRRGLLDSPLKALCAEWPEVLIIAPWPEPRPEEGWEIEKLADFGLVQELVRSIRNLRAENNVKANRRVPAILVSSEHNRLLTQQAGLLASLAYLDGSQLSIHASLESKPEDSIVGVVSSVEVYLPLAGLVARAEDQARLEKELALTNSQIERLEALLASDFASKAPEAVVAKEREKLAVYQQTAQKIRSQLG
jgi:valyl-tRNA synthetase